MGSQSSHTQGPVHWTRWFILEVKFISQELRKAHFLPRAPPSSSKLDPAYLLYVPPQGETGTWFALLSLGPSPQVGSEPRGLMQGLWPWSFLEFSSWLPEPSSAMYLVFPHEPHEQITVLEELSSTFDFPF